MESGASTPRDAQLTSLEGGEEAVATILAVQGSCGVPRKGMAAEALRLALVGDGPMSAAVRAYLAARKCDNDFDFLVAARDFEHTRGPDDAAVRGRALEAYERYVKSGSPSEVSLPWRVSGELQSRVTGRRAAGRVGNDVFAAAADCVSEELARDAMGAFVAAHRRPGPLP